MMMHVMVAREHDVSAYFDPSATVKRCIVRSRTAFDSYCLVNVTLKLAEPPWLGGGAVIVSVAVPDTESPVTVPEKVHANVILALVNPPLAWRFGDLPLKFISHS
jgi:hypothetical protein